MGKWIKEPRKELFCPCCDKRVSYRIEEKQETFKVRGEEIEILSKVAVCSVCGEELLEPYLDDQNLLKVFKKYAERHGLVTPGEIQRIRRKYGLSQALFAKILGVGKATIERYEVGALPTESISNLIKSADSPEVFRELLEKNKDNLSESDYQRIISRLDGLEKVDKLRLSEIFFRALNGGNIDFSQLYGVVAGILKTFGRGFITKVKLMKLLWFVDKSYYEKYGKTLTGLKYAHLPMGHAPNEHDVLLRLLEKSGTVEVQREITSEDAEMIKIFLKDGSMIKYLDKRELEVVQEIVAQYGPLNTKELIDLSHQDERWQNTRDGELIEL